MTIFADYARHYWNANLPVIPLKPWDFKGAGAGKAPFLSEWSAYSRNMPSKDIQNLWIQSYPNSNIGLPFGTASRLCAIDIDTEDQALIDAILDVLPVSPWKRVGKKGMGLIYKWQGQPNFKLRDSNNQSIVEFLGEGNQMVMPPSIHPDTGKAYVANTNLWEVLDKIQPMPVDIEKQLREALSDVMGERGLSLAHSGRSKPLEVVPQGERDIQLVRHAGYLARVVLGIDRSEKFTLLEAMQHMHHWVETYTARVTGDAMDPAKGVDKLLEFLLKDSEKGKTMPDGWDTGLTEDHRSNPVIAALMKNNEVQRWTYTKAKVWLSETIAEAGSEDEILRACFEIVEKVASDEQFSFPEFSVLATEIKRQAGDLGISKPDLTRHFKECRAGDEDTGADHEQIARYAIEEFERGGELRYWMGRFWQWNGSCFGELEDVVVYNFVAESIKGNVLSRRHQDYVSIVRTIQSLVRRPLVEGVEDGINFANGFLTVDGSLQDHSPRFGKTFTMPFDYVPERAGECHKWLEFLEDSWGDDPDYAEKVMALQEAFAATMFGVGTKYQRAILLYGKAGAGKSVALEVLRAMMPPAAVSSIPPHRWGGRFDLSGMVGKTLNVCGELPENSNIEGDKFKGVVCGEIQHTELKMKDGFDFNPRCIHWFASNFLPRSGDSSAGFTRRWLILEFNNPVPMEKRIPNFAEILVADEREAIAAWAVQGLKRLSEQNGYTIPSSHEARVNQVFRGNNSVAAWLQSSDKIIVKNGEFADARPCFDHYVLYMKDTARGFNVTFERFLQMLDDAGHGNETYTDPTGVMKYRIKNIRLRHETLEDKWA